MESKVLFRSISQIVQEEFSMVSWNGEAGARAMTLSELVVSSGQVR